jgi:hypothetical protein
MLDSFANFCMKIQYPSINYQLFLIILEKIQLENISYGTIYRRIIKVFTTSKIEFFHIIGKKLNFLNIL